MRLMICLFALVSLAAPALAGLKSCQSLYLNGPKKFAGYNLAASKNYEKDEKGGGYSLQFDKGKRARVTLFFYDEGRRNVSREFMEQIFADVAVTAFKFVIVSWAENGASTISFEPAPADINIDEKAMPSGMPVLRAWFHPRASGFPKRNEYILMTVSNNCMVKLRFSMSGNKNAADRKYKQVEAQFIRQYAK